MLTSGRRRGGLMVSALVPGLSGDRPGLSSGRGHCVVFLGRTLNSRQPRSQGTRLNSHSASLHPGV